MTSGKTVAKAVGGKTARACDSCIRKRARWYCAADDAFLCQSCDSLVHSANPLARRHERVRLKTASSKSSDVASVPAAAAAAELNLAPAWHRGFTKKARTPRHGKHHSWTTHQTPRGQDEPMRNPFHLVPEVGSDEYSNSHDENEEQLLYRVPIFDPFVAELCTPPSSVTSTEAAAVAGSNEVDNNESKRTESKVSLGNNNSNNSSNNNNNSVGNLHGGFLPSEMELAEFAADVESILGRGLENECIGMEDLGLIDSKEKEESRECSVGSEKVVKVEDEESPCKVEMGIREPFELSFDYESPATCEEAGEEKVGLDGGKHMKNINDAEIKGINNQRTRKTLSLQLDYEAVISTWASQKSPWTTGDKPDFDPDECWPDCMGTCGMEVHQAYYSGMGGYGCHTAMGDGGREARVSRYREKRRTRLFSKKIRYEVRKLNAEKRPRMKGRFVKRASFAVAAPPAFPLLNK